MTACTERWEKISEEDIDLDFREGIPFGDSQITLCEGNGREYLQYDECMSKNKRFGLKSTRIKPKCQVF